MVPVVGDSQRCLLTFGLPILRSCNFPLQCSCLLEASWHLTVCHARIKKLLASRFDLRKHMALHSYHFLQSTVSG
jgi:hypothetical protein